MLSGSDVRCHLKSSTVDVSHSTHYTEKNGVGFTLEPIFTQKLLVNFTHNYKEMASNSELNMKVWSTKSENFL